MESFEWLQEASRKEASGIPDTCSASWGQGQGERNRGALMDERLPPLWGSTGPVSATAKDPHHPLEKLVCVRGLKTMEATQ